MCSLRIALLIGSHLITFLIFMLEIKRRPEDIKRPDWQIIEEVDIRGVKGAAWRLRISRSYVYRVLKRNKDKLVPQGSRMI